MSKRSLSPDLQKLESDIISTLIAGHKEWRPDLAYPESHSDMQGAVRGLLRMFEVKRLPVARELTYHEDAPDMLARHFRRIWQKEVADGKTTRIIRYMGGRGRSLQRRSIGSAMDTELALKILKAEKPSMSLKAGDNGEHELDLDGEKFTVSTADADLLFRTMFFRGKLDLD